MIPHSCTCATIKTGGLRRSQQSNNLIVFSVPETENETVEMLKVEVIGNIFKNTLVGVFICSAEHIHRLGIRGNGKTKPVILKLYNYSKNTAVLGKCKKIEGSEIIINNDYSQATLEKHKLSWASAKVERERNDKVQLIHDKLKINGDLFT